jgi:quinol-cytochrome oxidoreductase complex cytochrome b subunit
MFQTLKYIPGKILFIDGEVLGILLFGLAGLLWMLVPFWDRKSPRGERNRFVNYVGIFVIFYIIILTVIGWIV